MPLKLKLTLIFLVVVPMIVIGAVVAVVRANSSSVKANLAGAIRPSSTAQVQRQNSSPAPEAPAYDYDADKDKTITQIFSEKMLGGFASGELNPSLVSSAQYNQLLDVVSTKIINDRDNLIFPAAKIQIVEYTSDDQLKSYLRQSTEIINRIPSQSRYLELMKNPDGPSAAAQKEFADLGTLLRQAYADLAALPAPSVMAGWQASMLRGLRQLSLVYTGLGQFDVDPMLVVYRLDEFPDALTDVITGADDLSAMDHTYELGITVHSLTD